MNEPESYAIAVVGGATAGAEAARIFSAAGFYTVIFEQNPRPYGKVEDGLPKWHVGLRRKEYDAIDSKLQLPHVHFVPKTKMGADLDFGEVVESWGFHAVVLANGAWRDRPLPIEDADRFVGKGLIYQNPFIYWFNHSHEPTYAGETYPIEDGMIVVGGGLASIDVAKLIQFELVRRELRKRKSVDVDVETLDVNGVPAVLKEYGLEWSDLGLRGCTIYYRRSVEDMPLAEIPPGADDAKREKVRAARRRILEKAAGKFLFQIEPLCAPDAILADNDRLVGMRFRRTRLDGGKVIPTDETLDVPAPAVVSSIGSIPEPVRGVAMKGELYAYSDWNLGRFEDHPTVFSVGNVVTGKGNLVASRKHANQVANYMVEEYIHIADQVKRMPPLPPDVREQLVQRVTGAQARVGYDGDYPKWIEKVTPPGFV